MKCDFFFVDISEIIPASDKTWQGLYFVAIVTPLFLNKGLESIKVAVLEHWTNLVCLKG